MGILKSLSIIALLITSTTTQAGEILLTIISGDAFSSGERIQFYAITNSKNQLVKFRMDTYYWETIRIKGKKERVLQCLPQEISHSMLYSENGFAVRAKDVVIPAFKEARGFMANQSEVLFSFASRNIKGKDETRNLLSPDQGGLLKLTIVKSVRIAAALGVKVVANDWLIRWFSVSKNSYGQWTLYLWDPSAANSKGGKGKYVSASYLYMVSNWQNFIGSEQMTGVKSIRTSKP